MKALNGFVGTAADWTVTISTGSFGDLIEIASSLTTYTNPRYFAPTVTATGYPRSEDVALQALLGTNMREIGTDRNQRRQTRGDRGAAEPLRRLRLPRPDSNLSLRQGRRVLEPTARRRRNVESLPGCSQLRGWKLARGHR